MQKEKLIILSAGGTGGHVFPAITVAKELQARGYKVMFATDTRCKKYFKNKDCIVQNINCKTKIKMYISVMLHTLTAVLYLIKHRPLCVVGFGGYPSVPFVMAAQILGIKTIIHEQNATVGKANKLLKFLCKKMLLSFDIKDNLGTVVGMPTRYEDMYNNFQYSATRPFSILVLGGSQGSAILSDAAVKAITQLKADVFVCHQARENDVAFVQEQYRKAGIKCVVSNFFEDMSEIYKSTTIAIARSGSSTVCELIGFGVPAIFVPYEASINGDQIKNAQYVERSGGCFIVREDQIQNLGSIIQNLEQDREKLINMSNNLKTLRRQGVINKIADEIENVINSIH